MVDSCFKIHGCFEIKEYSMFQEHVVTESSWLAVSVSTLWAAEGCHNYGWMMSIVVDQNK